MYQNVPWQWESGQKSAMTRMRWVISIAGCTRICHDRMQEGRNVSWQWQEGRKGWYQELIAASRVPIIAPVIPRKSRV